MNLSQPILICDKNEDFRILIRDMLTKNGFFHVFEASEAQEVLRLLKEKNNFFVLIEARELSRELEQILSDQKNFLVLCGKSDAEIIPRTVRLGVSNIMTYPIHSRRLIDKINSLI